MSIRLCAAALAAVLVLAGCEKEEKRFDPPDRAARVAAADTLFAEAVWDTITWASPEERLFVGNDVYAANCRRCHGPLGEGDTEYALERQLDVPSLVEPGWEYDGDLHAVRHRIFVGHQAGMPTWGVAGISLREIDAAAHYVLDQLRPEVLGQPRPAAPR